MTKGTLFIVSAPSGAGKTSLVKALRESLTGFKVSISHTTRASRKGEEHGRDYFFVDEPTFLTMVEAGEFLEYARVFNNHYGTARKTVESALQQGQDILLEIDWQGARLVRSILPDSVSVFILPPSLEALRQRLESRGQDNPETIERRMQEALAETSHYREYDYLIINDNFNTALDELRAIVTSHRTRLERQIGTQQNILENLLGSHN